MALAPQSPVHAADPPRLNRPGIGILLMATGFLLFSVVDMLAKLLAGSLHPLQVVWFRQSGLLIGVLVLLALRGPKLLRTTHPGLQLARGTLAALSSVFFVFALRQVALADAVAVSFVAPFIATILGALILGEKVGLRRWTAVAIGFAGTLVVIRPGLGVIHPSVLLVVVAASLFALRQVASRALSGGDPTLTTVAYTALTASALLTLPLPFVWQAPESLWQLGLLGVMALFAAFGEIAVIRALELADVVVLTPLHYSLIVWSTFWGWLVFRDLPDRWTLLGTAIIIATGLYTINRERAAKARAPG